MNMSGLPLVSVYLFCVTSIGTKRATVNTTIPATAATPMRIFMALAVSLSGKMNERRRRG
jgi:hypothetical protein